MKNKESSDWSSSQPLARPDNYKAEAVISLSFWLLASAFHSAACI
jgi:hypothetical protein